MNGSSTENLMMKAGATYTFLLLLRRLDIHVIPPFSTFDFALRSTRWELR